MPSQHLVLSADKPILSESEDLLGRAPFARAVATALAGWHQDQSLVVGVYGPWGSGKTSVKNLVARQIATTSPSTVLVDFNPWLWSSRDRMLAAFYREIGLALGNLGDKGGKTAGERWAHYSALMQLSGTVAEHVKTALDVTGLGVIGLAVDAASKTLKKGASLAKQAAQTEQTLKAVSVRKIKDELTDCLTQLNASVLVVIDDIDRLTPDEIRLLFQLIKSNADFPNLIYLLLCDREVVEAALTREGLDGAAYMEKIVQVGLDLPIPSPQGIARVLRAGVEKLLQVEGAQRAFSKDRWLSMYHFSLQHLFKTIRDVRRFLSSLSFQTGLFRNTDTFEANVVDLIGVEALRQFAHRLYVRMPAERKLLLGAHDLPSYLRDKDSEKKLKVGRVTSLLGLVDEPIREPISHLLKELFPEVSELLGTPHVSESASDLRIMLRIADETFFDRYFVFGVPDGDIPQARINRLVRAAANRTEFVAGLRQLAAEGNLRAALVRLEPQIPTFPTSDPRPVVAAFFDAGEFLTGEQSVFGKGEGRLACMLLGQYLMRFEDRRDRGRSFLDAMRMSDGVYLATLLLLYESDTGDPRFGKDGLLDGDTRRKAEAICGRKISSLLSREDVPAELLGIYLYCLRQWRKGEAEKHEKRLLKTPQGALKLLRTLTRMVTSSHTGMRLEIKLEDANRIGVEKVRKVLSPLLKKRIDDCWQPLAKQEADVLGAFRRAIERKKTGKPDSDFD